MFASLRWVALAAVAGFPAVASPQQPQARPESAAGPRLEATATAVRVVSVTAPDSAARAVAQRNSMGKPVALMIVGGAAIVVGAIIGGSVGTLFMVGGAVAGLIGLYQYLR